jgi:hypothetical protein
MEYIVKLGKGGLMDFHERLKALRQEKKVNQTVIADILNVGQRQVSYYESGPLRRDRPQQRCVWGAFDVERNEPNRCWEYFSGNLPIR